MIHVFKNKKGFTLVEMLVAIGLFTVISSFSIGAVLSIFDANRNARSSKTVVDNLNLSIENMVRTVRFGTNYHCGSSGTLSSPNNWNTENPACTFLAIQFEGNTIIYRQNGNAIQKSSNGGLTYENITSSDTVISYLRFYVLGSTAGDTSQPYVLAVIRGYVGSKPTSQSSFVIQTTMSQRGLDL